MPDPGVGARHERGVGGDGRTARGRGRVRRRRQRRPRRPRRRRSHEHADAARGADGDVPVDPRRVRGAHPRHLRARARARRAGVPRRREPQRARRRRAARASSAPTCRTSTCTRRSASRTAAAVPGVGPIGVRAHLAPFLPNHPLRPEAGPATGIGAISGGAVGLGRHPADLVGVHRDDGRRGAARARRRSRSSTRTTSRAGSRRTTRCSTRGANGLVAHECIIDLRPITHDDRRDRRRRRQAAHRLRLPRADDVVPGRGHADDRADGVGGPARARPLLSTR